jgi:hypothetical protein
MQAEFYQLTKRGLCMLTSEIEGGSKISTPVEGMTGYDANIASASGTRFNTTIERKTEHIWFEAKHLGWSYSKFVVRMIEVLIILQLRDMVSRRQD